RAASSTSSTSTRVSATASSRPRSTTRARRGTDRRASRGRARSPFMTLSYNQIAARGLERIAALSDGLFAIAMTLIVFEIRIPDPGVVRTEQDLWAAMVALGPRLITYLLSFLTLGIFWTGPQTQSHYFARSDRHLAWLQLAFLAAVPLMPFTTSLLP